MSSEVDIEQNMWSDCSIKSSLPKRDKNLIGIKCLAQKAKPMSQDLTVTDSDLYKRPGLYISADKQCQMAFGPKFSYKLSQRTSICQALKCRDDFFVVQTWGALEGTECGHISQCTNSRCRRLTYDTDNYSASGRAIVRSRYTVSTDGLLLLLLTVPFVGLGATYMEDFYLTIVYSLLMSLGSISTITFCLECYEKHVTMLKTRKIIADTGLPAQYAMKQLVDPNVDVNLQSKAPVAQENPIL
ncbi:unnamed protein product [Oppiella nova]|uniref:ADAMTS cysteine-rich domain-containing protein n=1 Tax=Oppiella nova TaxID=334625 RepID=A0A7R9LY33_9ACAR|nr:unnamed protein product [Oppiella nova]CAG2168060.1 unnamed protein product [Oppiella nova]